MGDPNISKWKASGNTYLWRYLDNERNYPGWHLTADHEACEALSRLFNLMEEAKYSVKVRIPVLPPRDAQLKVPNNQGGRARWRSVDFLEFRFDPQQRNSALWSLELDKNTLSIEFGRAKLDGLKSGVEDISNRDGDYSIGPDDAADSRQCLWFWWH